MEGTLFWKGRETAAVRSACRGVGSQCRGPWTSLFILAFQLHFFASSLKSCWTQKGFCPYRTLTDLSHFPKTLFTEGSYPCAHWYDCSAWFILQVMTALHFSVPFGTTGCLKGWCRRGNLQMHCCHNRVRDFSNFPSKGLRLLFCWFIQFFALAVLPQSHWIYVAVKQLHVALCVCSSVSVVLSFIKHWSRKCGNSQLFSWNKPQQQLLSGAKFIYLS